MSISEAKLVIVIRKDLKMRRGKEIAQAGHACCSWLTQRLRLIGKDALQDINRVRPTMDLTNAEAEWVMGRFKKICLVVNSEAELMEIHEKARQAGLQSNLIVDAGDTEFHGVPTPTCIGIGPDYPEKIDPITGHLKLY